MEMGAETLAQLRSRSSSPVPRLQHATDLQKNSSPTTPDPSRGESPLMLASCIFKAPLLP